MTAQEKHARAMAAAAKYLENLKGAARDYTESPTHQREVWLVEAARHLTNARHAVGRAAKQLAEEDEQARASYGRVMTGLPRTKAERAAYKALTGREA